MSSAEIRQQLHVLIEKADSDLLEIVYSILKKPERNLGLSPLQLEELERRYAAHLENPSEGSSWEEVKARVSRKNK